jgi:HEAT repeat protein
MNLSPHIEEMTGMLHRFSVSTLRRSDAPTLQRSYALTLLRSYALALAAVLMLAQIGASATAADSTQEQRLIDILQSGGSSPQEKDTACVELKKVGTAACVPALAALLTDPQLSQSARYVLESMDAPEAGRALSEALAKTSDQLKAGIINSLGNRREAGATSALTTAILDADTDIARAAAIALGKIGGPSAVKSLTSALTAANASVHDAVVNALLRAANRFLSTSDNASAAAIFQQLYQHRETSAIRTAAYAGIIRAAGQEGLTLIVKGIEGTDGPTQLAALQLARDPRGPATGEALATLLPKSKPPVQVALLEALSQRGEVVPGPAIANLARTGTPEVREAALEALGALGDAAIVPLLVKAASAETGSLQAVARQALNCLNRGPVMEALVAQLKEGQPAVQAEAARALGERRETAAVPTLFALAENAPDSTRKVALQALALLVKPEQLDSFVQFVAKASTEAARSDAAQALNVAFQRIRTTEGKVSTAPLVRALSPGNPVEARAALLSVCSGLPDPEIRASLQTALADSVPQIRTAAIRALCDTIDPELLPDLLKVACSAPEDNFRTLAIGGCVRLTTQEEAAKLPIEQRVNAFKTILATQLNTQQKKQVLSGLAETPDPSSLKLVEPMLAEADVRSEAAAAAVKIASTLAEADLATAVLKKVVTVATDGGTRQAAQAALKQIDARSGFIIAWQVAGPYRQANKNYAALFDISFPPEAPDASDIHWRTLPVSSDPSRPWSMDLLKFLGGEQCVAYARTWIYSLREQSARMEIGSDDGAKIWLNHKLVHSNNTARPLQPGQDKTDVLLKQGWNPLLIKVTQNNLGWEFCLRLTQPDGSRIEALRASLSPNN